MLRQLSRGLCIFTAGAGLLVSSLAQAQGLFAGSKGARVAGRGGAYGAKADDLSAVEYNPAGLTRLGTTKIQLSNRFSYNMVNFQREPAFENADGTGDYVQFSESRNQQPVQALDPMIGVGSNFGLEDFAAAFVAYAPPGAARLSFPQGDIAYPSEGGQRYMMVARDAEILIYALSGAYKYKQSFGVGATAQWIHVPRLNYSLVVAPILFGNGGNQVNDSLDMLSQVETSSLFTFNAVLGAWVRPIPSLELALSGQVIPTAIKAKGTMEVETAEGGSPLETTRRDPVTGVEEPADDVTIRVPLPMWARLAARYFKGEGANFKYDIELDVTYHTWSRVQTIDLASNGLTASLPSGSLEIGDVSIQKQWKDGVTVQLGGDYAVLPERLTLRAGAGFESAIASPAYSHVDFPTGPQISGALGGSVFIGHVELALAYAYRHMLTVTTTAVDGKVYQVTPGSSCVAPYDNPNLCSVPGQPSPTVNGGRYNSSNHFLNIDVIYGF